MPGPAKIEGGSSTDGETDTSGDDSTSTTERIRDGVSRLDPRQFVGGDDEADNENSPSESKAESGTESAGGTSPGRAQQEAEEAAEQSSAESDDSKSDGGGSSPGRARERAEEASKESSDRYGTGSARNKAEAVRRDTAGQLADSDSRYGTSGILSERLLKKEIESRAPGLDVDVGRTEDGGLTVENVEKNEQFGDFQVKVPGTGGKTVENYLEAGSKNVSNAIRDTSSALFDEGKKGKPGGIASESIIAKGLEETARDMEAAGYGESAGKVDMTATAFEGGLRSFGKGTFEGAANLANVPSVALGLKEGVEYLGYAGSKTLAGEGGEVADQTGDALATAGASAVDAAKSNPAKFSGQLVGSLAGSYSAIAGASKASSTAGRAAAYAIQPGEEIVGGLATKAASKTATGSRLVSKMPGGKLDNEELAIYAGKKAGQKLRNAVDDPRVKQFLRDDRGQGQLTLTKERTKEESTEETTETSDELSDLDKELERIREKVSNQDVRETDEWTPDETDNGFDTETESTPTEDLREKLNREKQESVDELDDSTPTKDVRERSTTELEQSDVGVKPGQSKSLDQTMREVADVEKELQEQFGLETETETATETTAEMETATEVGRLEATTLEETTTLRDLQEDVQADLDVTVTEVGQETTVEDAVEFFDEVETSMETEVDTSVELDTEVGQEFESFEKEVESEFEREQEREKEPFSEEDPNADGVFEDDTDRELFSTEYENPVTSVEEADQVFEDIDQEMEGIFE